MRQRTLVLAVAALVASVTVRLGADADRLKSAAAVLTEMAGTPDGISDSFFDKAKCVVVIPGVKKAAIGLGGQYGRGYISCRKAAGGWSAPGGIRLEGGSVGLQIGGSDTDVILLVLNDRGVDRLLASRFTVGADAAVAAGPVGRQASAETDATMMAEILAWSRSRGVFAGISLQGSTLREDTTENHDLYGKTITNKEIVTSDTTTPKDATPFLDALTKYK